MKLPTITDKHWQAALCKLNLTVYASSAIIANEAAKIAQAELDNTPPIGLVKVDNVFMSQEEARAIWDVKKCTYDVFCKSVIIPTWDILTYPVWSVYDDKNQIEYQLRPKKQPLKLIDWNNPLMRGCVTNRGQIISSNKGESGIRVMDYETGWISYTDKKNVRLAPPKDATSNWQVYHHGVTDLDKLEGVEVEIKYWDYSWNSCFTVITTKYLSTRIAAYRLTGKLLDGYTDDPSKV